MLWCTWYVAVGDAVAEDEVVCEIETDKVAMPCFYVMFHVCQNE